METLKQAQGLQDQNLVKKFIQDELKSLSKSIISTPSREYLEEFAQSNKGTSDMLLMQFAIQYGYKLALDSINDLLDKERQSKTYYFLVGDDACAEFESNGIDGVIEQSEANELGYNCVTFTDGGSIHSLLQAFSGMKDYISLSKEEYTKLES